MKKYRPSLAKFIRFSDLSFLNEENSQSLLSILRKTFGNGFYVDYDLNNIISYNTINVNGNNYLNFFVGDGTTFNFLDDIGFSEIAGGSLNYFSIIFDEKRPINGSESNKIIFEKTSFPVENIPNYSQESVPVLYVNGTPQFNSDFVATLQENELSLYFNKIRGGYIYPIPKNKYGKFSSSAFTGTTFANFRQDFCDENLNCYFDFGFLNIVSTNRVLAIKITSSSNTTIYHVPKNIPIYNNNLYYLASPQNPSVAVINLSDIPINDTDEIEVFFLEEAKAFTTSTENVKVNLFSINAENLSYDTLSSAKVLILDEQRGIIEDITSINQILFGESYVINIANSSIQINSSLLTTEKNRVFVVDYYYLPPVKIDNNLDYLNNLTIYGRTGGAYKIQQTPKTIYIYVKNNEVPKFGTTYYDSTSKVVSEAYVYEVLPYFVVSDSLLSRQDLTYMGSFNISSPSVVNFTPTNSQVIYNNILQTLQNITSPPIWRTIAINNSTYLEQNNSWTKIPILPILKVDGKTTTIKAISLYIDVLDQNNTPIPFTLKLSIIDGSTILTETTLASLISTGNNKFYSFGAENLFNNGNIMSLTFSQSAHLNPTYYLLVYTSTPNFKVISYSSIIYYEHY